MYFIITYKKQYTYILCTLNELMISFLDKKYLIKYYLSAKVYSNNQFIYNAYKYKNILDNIINVKNSLYDLKK